VKSVIRYPQSVERNRQLASCKKGAHEECRYKITYFTDFAYFTALCATGFLRQALADGPLFIPELEAGATWKTYL
jgi:hypothetical protein